MPIGRVGQDIHLPGLPNAGLSMGPENKRPMNCSALKFSRHAFERMFTRGIDPDTIAEIVAKGEMIAEYPEDRPIPSALVLGFHEGCAAHVVVARDDGSGECHIITV